MGAEKLIRRSELGVLSAIASANMWEIAVDSVGNARGTLRSVPGGVSFVGRGLSTKLALCRRQNSCETGMGRGKVQALRT